MRTIAKRDDCTRTEAMTKARLAHPEDFQRWQSEGTATSRPSVIAKAVPGAVRDFNDIVTNLMTSRGMTGMAAMKEARRSRPDLLAAYQRAGMTSTVIT